MVKIAELKMLVVVDALPMLVEVGLPTCVFATSSFACHLYDVHYCEQKYFED